MALRANCRFIPNGLAKRTIGLTGSDGLKYRVISYFFPLDVEHLFTPGMSGRLKPPSHYPEFQPFIEKANQQKLSPEAGLPTSSESKEKPIKPKPQKSSESVETANRTKPSPPTPYARPQPQQTPMKPMQQPEQFHVRQCPQSEPSANDTVEPSVPSPVPSEQTCPCGGLGGSRKAVDYFKGKDVSWVNRPVVLAPLRGQLDRR
ncbi:hypothetical protein HDU79_006182 [Rhizoclosmatium sp. JEL0117]|nr:hypothetical protein HDU79_006182 [Rhizoclosmatium sp. JEL0117]